jgi:hypothetical protein
LASSTEVPPNFITIIGGAPSGSSRLGHERREPRAL